MKKIISDSEELPGVKCNIRELDEVLMRDVGNRIKDSGKWPLMIDPTGQASTFLRYRDTNYLCALNPKQMNEEVVRLAILGAIRFTFFSDSLYFIIIFTISKVFSQSSVFANSPVKHRVQLYACFVLAIHLLSSWLAEK